MRENATMLARTYRSPHRRENLWLSSQAPANAEAECPEGKDQVPGFFPMTIAWMIVMNGRRRLKYALIGNSTSAVVMVSGRTISRKYVPVSQGLRRAASASVIYQNVPPLNATVRL